MKRIDYLLFIITNSEPAEISNHKKTPSSNGFSPTDLIVLLSNLHRLRKSVTVNPFFCKEQNCLSAREVWGMKVFNAMAPIKKKNKVRNVHFACFVFESKRSDK